MAKPILDQHIRVHNSRLPNNAMYVKRKEKTGCITEGVFFIKYLHFSWDIVILHQPWIATAWHNISLYNGGRKWQLPKIWHSRGLVECRWLSTKRVREDFQENGRFLETRMFPSATMIIFCPHIVRDFNRYRLHFTSEKYHKSLNILRREFIVQVIIPWTGNHTVTNK